MDATTLTVFALPGSLRTGSFNRSLLAAAAAHAPEGVSIVVDDGLATLPFFSQDTEGDRTPAAVLGLRDRIAETDAVLVATPEYNGGMSGVLKNALDWLSRPTGESVLADKPAAAIGASPGRFGASRAQAEVRRVLTAIGASVLDTELAVAKAHEAFDGDGLLVDPDVQARLVRFVAEFTSFVAGPSADERQKSAAYSVACQQHRRPAA
jgi:chromate reductase